MSARRASLRGWSPQATSSASSAGPRSRYRRPFGPDPHIAYDTKRHYGDFRWSRGAHLLRFGSSRSGPVPTGLTTGALTRIQVASTSGTSSAVPLIASSANPGVFTYEAGGGGQAKAINQDGSPNGDGRFSPVSPPPGSIIQVYATGLGAVIPALPRAPRPPSSPLIGDGLARDRQIAGRAATVTFAGLAPGMIGVYQVNIIVPPSTLSGTARLALSANGIGSQTGVTIQIK